MTWIRDGPKCLNAKNITEAIDGSYVPMFGEIEYDPTRQFCSIPIDEQLDALGRAVYSGKSKYVGLSNETPYGVMKFVQVAERSTRHPKIVSGISLLAYSPLAMGILSGKYFLPDGRPADARLNLFRGKYLEGEPRYNLSDHIIRAAAMEYIDIAGNYSVHPVSLAIGSTPLPPILYSFFMFLSTLGLWFGDLMLENE
ncbi:PREDICTED: aldo-keto reductase-like isoform X1 [Prunus mume]|uniref:Aldo-keto reductase-like isoform X1 n=1 Tax=Prunus mume TaxID=102107 RepID=A0ABM1LJ49_PRUMU|nr:PREDICTED: aldo-keto reductase-like isoform X1 [Prunus mume]